MPSRPNPTVSAGGTGQIIQHPHSRVPGHDEPPVLERVMCREHRVRRHPVPPETCSFPTRITAGLRDPAWWCALKPCLQRLLTSSSSARVRWGSSRRPGGARRADRRHRRAGTGRGRVLLLGVHADQGVAAQRGRARRGTAGARACRSATGTRQRCSAVATPSPPTGRTRARSSWLDGAGIGRYRGTAGSAPSGEVTGDGNHVLTARHAVVVAHRQRPARRHRRSLASRPRGLQPRSGVGVEGPGPARRHRRWRGGLGDGDRVRGAGVVGDVLARARRCRGRSRSPASGCGGAAGSRCFGAHGAEAGSVKRDDDGTVAHADRRRAVDADELLVAIGRAATAGHRPGDHRARAGCLAHGRRHRAGVRQWTVTGCTPPGTSPARAADPPGQVPGPRGGDVIVARAKGEAVEDGRGAGTPRPPTSARCRRWSSPTRRSRRWA